MSRASYCGGEEKTNIPERQKDTMRVICEQSLSLRRNLPCPERIPNCQLTCMPHIY